MTENGHQGKKQISITDILNSTGDEISKYFQQAEGADFDERIKKFEEYHNPEHKIQARLLQHAQYVIQGHPTNEKEYPGVYRAAHKTLDEIVASDNDKLESEEQVLKVMESYVDQFLEKAASVEGHIKETLELAKKRGLSEEDMRRLKGRLFARYHATQEGAVNPLDERFVKELVGKTKFDLKQQLGLLAQASTQAYVGILGRPAQNLLKESDLPKLVEHMDKQFKDLYEHEEDLILRPEGVRQLAREYATHLSAGNMQEHGYTRKQVRAAEGGHGTGGH